MSDKMKKGAMANRKDIMLAALYTPDQTSSCKMSLDPQLVIAPTPAPAMLRAP